MPATVTSTFQGNAQAFQDSLSTVPMLIVAALIVVYLILGVLYESYIHPLTILSTLPSAGVGALATLMLFHFDFSLIALIGIILLIGIVKKNGIMMVDFAIVAERDHHLPRDRGHPARRHPALPADHDDHHGGDARRRAADAGPGHRRRDQAAARLRDGRAELLVSQALTLFTTPVVLSLSRPAVAVAEQRMTPAAQGSDRSPEGRPRMAQTAARRRRVQDATCDVDGGSAFAPGMQPASA